MWCLKYCSEPMISQNTRENGLKESYQLFNIILRVKSGCRLLIIFSFSEKWKSPVSRAMIYLIFEYPGISVWVLPTPEMPLIWS